MLSSVIRILLLAYLVAFCQTLLANLTDIHGISPNFGTLIIFMLVLKGSFRTAFIGSFITALIIDALNPEMLGVGLAVRISLATALWELKRKMDLDRVAARLYLLMGMEAAFQLLYQAAASGFDPTAVGFIMLEVSLPTLIYTSLVGLVAIVLSDLSVKIEVKRRSRES
jgi:cell shape-determining protein MreD